MMAKNLKTNKEFLVQTKASKELRQTVKKQKPFHFKVSQESLQNVKEVTLFLKLGGMAFLFRRSLLKNVCLCRHPSKSYLNLCSMAF